MIRRTASEILHDLEMRVARLEEGRTAARNKPATVYFYGDRLVLEQLRNFAKGWFGDLSHLFHTWFEGDMLCIETPYGRKGVEDMLAMMDDGGFQWKWKNRSQGSFVVWM